MSEIGIDQGDRLRALVGAGIALSSELSLDELLKRLVETAAVLTRARYVALGVIDRDGDELERFITHGIDGDGVKAIGDLPRGGGILACSSMTSRRCDSTISAWTRARSASAEPSADA